METDENSSGALRPGEHGWGSHRLQSPGSVRRPLVESECTGNCNRSNCGFLLDVNADANMVCVPVDDDMEGENVQLRRGVRERKRTSNGEAQNAKKPRAAVAAEKDEENYGAAASIPVLGESGSSKTQTILGCSSKVGGWAGLSAVGPRASWCGYGDALWKKHRAGRARVHRGTHGFVCWESMNLIDHGHI